jgi:hypothetical protein
VVDFDKATWTAINHRSGERLATRTTKLISDPEALVKRATVLLGSYQWSEIAAGLAVVTGRRCTEVIQTAQFEYKTKYSVIFTGSLKRRNEPVECVFEIPTLCEAQLVINAIACLRAQLGEVLHGLSPRQVSSRYGSAVAAKCDRYFDQLIPKREDKDNLYTHLFRAVYATIAAYWFCPPTVPVMEFRAAIQGHYQILDEQNPQLRRSLAAGRNYFDYQIGDGFGNIDGRLGIKLNLPDVKVVEQFQHASTSLQNTTINKTLSRQVMSEQFLSSPNSAVVIPSFFLSRLEAIATRLGLNQAETIQALFTWTEMGLSLARSLELDELHPQAVFEAVEGLKQASVGASSQFALGASLSNSTPPNTHSDVLLERQQALFKLCNNDAEGRAHQDKWYIGIGSIRTLTGRGDKVIRRVLQQRQDVEQHHHQHRLDSSHNLKGKNSLTINEVISLD